MRLVILMLIKDRTGIQECIELEWTEVSLVRTSHFTEEENNGPDITQGTRKQQSLASRPKSSDSKLTLLFPCSIFGIEETTTTNTAF